ncbi:MAG TPA: hypothetical protein VES42_08640 [Pilimelia sp.]|nr:hypothetical protein [Pilimelia sp.]
MEADQQETLPALGQPAGDPTDTETLHQPDIAGEHEDTAVDKSITAGTDRDRETESPDGWAGMAADDAG